MSKPAMPTNMMNLYGQSFNNDLSSTLSNVLENAGGGKGYGADLFSRSGDTGMMMEALTPNYADGGAVHEALALARQGLKGGGHPVHVGAYNFHPHFEGERDALIRAILAEARGEGDAGMSAVAHNVVNRAHAGYRGHNDIQSTLLDQKPDGTAGQYTSFVANNKANIAGRNAMQIPMDSQEYRHAGDIADRALGGIEQDPTHGSSHYRNAAHSSAASNKWANQLEGKMTIGHHDFGREHGFHVPPAQPNPQIGDQNMLARMPQGNSMFPKAESLSEQIANPFGRNNMTMPASMQMGAPMMRPNMGPPMPHEQGPPMPPNMGPANTPLPPTRPDHFGPMVNAPMPPNRPGMGPGLPMAHQNVGPGLPMAHANMGPMQSEMGWKPPMEIADRAPNALINQPAQDLSPARDIAPANAFNAPEAGGLVSADVANAPVFDPPVPIGGESVPFDSLADIFSGFKRGGRAGFNVGGDAQENQSQEDRERLPMLARAPEMAQMAAIDRVTSRPSSNPSDFIAHELRADGTQLPQSNEAEGWRTGERAGLMAAGLAPGSGLASASGYFPSVDHQGGFEPSMRENIREGNYGTAAMQGLGVIGDVAYAAPGIGTILGGAMKAPLAAKLAMAAAPAARLGHNVGPALETSVEAAPQFEHLINPAGFGSRGWEAANTILPEGARSWQEMRSLLTNPQKGAVTPEEMRWADFSYADTDKVTRDQIAEQFRRSFPMLSNANYGNFYNAEQQALAADMERLNENARNAERAYEAALSNYQASGDLARAPNENPPPVMNAWQLYGLGRATEGRDERIADYLARTPEVLREPARAYLDAEHQSALTQNRLHALLDGNDANQMGEPRWGSYTAPGGDNYRVNALTLPAMPEGIHPSLTEEYEAARKAAQARIDDQRAHIDAMDRETQEALSGYEVELRERYRNKILNEMLDEKDPESFYNTLIARSGLTPEQALEKAKSLSGKMAEGAHIDAAAKYMGETDWLAAMRKGDESRADAVSLLRDYYRQKDQLGPEYDIRSQKLFEEAGPSYGYPRFSHETHLPGAQNPLVHTRYKDRVWTDPETGEESKVLSLEELQSDWGQMGKDEGFYDPKVAERSQEVFRQINALYDARSAEREEIREKYLETLNPLQDKLEELVRPATEKFYDSKKLQSDVDEYNKAYEAAEAVYGPQIAAVKAEAQKELDAMLARYQAQLDPLEAERRAMPKQGHIDTAPYVTKTDHWTDLGVKRALQEAIENGYGKVFIMGGEEQARRYQTDLRQQIKSVEWRPVEDTSFREVDIQPKSRHTLRFLVDQKGEIIEAADDRAIGKNVNALLGKQVGKQIMGDPAGNIDMSGYMMGSEGYRQFYEEKIPSRLKKILGNLDKDAKPRAGEITDADGESVKGVWLDITPKMVEEYTRLKKERGFAFYGYKKGGRAGYALGGDVEGEVSFAPDERHLAHLPKMAESKEAVNDALSIAGRDAPKSAHAFVQDRLFDPGDQKQLPQSDAEAGARTAKQWGLGLYGMTNIGGAQEALGYMPKAEGGYENSAWQDAREGHYGDAALKAMGLVIPGAGKIGKAAHAVEEALDTAKGASKAAGAFEAASPRIIRPQDVDTPTIRQVLEGNGYEVLPDSLNFAGVLDSPMRLQTPNSLKSAFEDALKYHTSLGRKDRLENSRDAMARLEQYLGQNSAGDLTPLLSENEKLKKAREIGLQFDGAGIETNGMALSPALQWGSMNICPGHAPCKTSCLGKKGGNYHKLGGGNDIYGLLSEGGNLNTPRANSLARTVAMMQDPQAFATRLYDELVAGAANANKNGAMLGARLNTLSDINPRVFKPFHDALDDISFYDYTKLNTNPVSPNHHLTYSSTGISTPEVYNPNGNWIDMRDNRLEKGQNVAMAFSHKSLIPEEVFDEQTGRTYRVVNGVEHDFRPADAVKKGERGVIVGLKNMDTGKTQEGAARASDGFLVNYDPQIVLDGKKQMKDAKGKPVAGNKRVTIPDQRQFEGEKKKRASGGRAARALSSEYFWQQFHNHDHYAQHGRKTRPEWWEIRSTPKRG